jgi:hypothetical protein
MLLKHRDYIVDERGDEGTLLAVRDVGLEGELLLPRNLYG